VPEATSNHLAIAVVSQRDDSEVHSVVSQRVPRRLELQLPTEVTYLLRHTFDLFFFTFPLPSFVSVVFCTFQIHHLYTGSCLRVHFGVIQTKTASFFHVREHQEECEDGGKGKERRSEVGNVLKLV
jgi:hypothetical protein